MDANSATSVGRNDNMLIHAVVVSFLSYVSEVIHLTCIYIYLFFLLKMEYLNFHDDQFCFTEWSDVETRDKTRE